MKIIKISRVVIMMLLAAAFLCSCDTGRPDTGEDVLDKNQTDSTSNENISADPWVGTELHILPF